MGTRSVRLDEETERALKALADKTGASLSTLLKRGILALRDQELEASALHPYELYCRLDLGPGGYALAPARKSREGIVRGLRKKRSR